MFLRVIAASLILLFGTQWAAAQNLNRTASYQVGFFAFTNFDSCKNTVVEASFNSKIPYEFINSEAFYFYYFDDIMVLKDYMCSDGGDERASGTIKISLFQEPAYERKFLWFGDQSRSQGRWILEDLTDLELPENSVPDIRVFGEAQSIMLNTFMKKNAVVDTELFNKDALERWAASDNLHLAYLAARLLPIADELSDPKTFANAIWYRQYAQNCEHDQAALQRAADLGAPQALFERIVCLKDLHFVESGVRTLRSLPAETQDAFRFHAAKAVYLGYLPVMQAYRRILTPEELDRMKPIFAALDEVGLTLSYAEFKAR